MTQQLRDVWSEVAQQTTAARDHAVRTAMVQKDMTARVRVPLQAYMDQDTVELRVRRWPQNLMFFLRTKRDHAWKSPKYLFGPLEQKRFSDMLEAAKTVI